MHLLVLSAFRPVDTAADTSSGVMSQCTFWCSVLSDGSAALGEDVPVVGLNAPFGAQCFPTGAGLVLDQGAPCLNAPFGAQCFPTAGHTTQEGDVIPSQCTFWCSVLSDRKT